MFAAVLAAFCLGAAAQPAPHKGGPATGKSSSTARATSAAPADSSPSSAAKSSAPASILPADFAGWVANAPPKSVTDPADADAANAPALKEFGMSTAESANYTRDGDSLALHAYRFSDASGAYGAYSFYRQSGWPKEEIGNGAASNHNRVLFWLGTTFVDATFSQVGPMSGAELRELASHMPAPEGNKALAPPVLANLPKVSLDGQTTHYAVGPAGYAGAGGVLPADLVGFDLGAEVATANYALRSGPATLTIIDYPTPQMAAAQEARIRDYIKAGNQPQQPWPKPLADSDQASLEVRRSGPLVAIVSGDAIPDESHKLIASVHYDATLISIPQPSENEIAKTGRLLFGIVTLIVIGGGTAILLGVFLGGGRALYRVARGRPVSAVYDEEFISLGLRRE